MAIMDEESVKIAVEGPVTEILLNRPKALNSLTPDVLHSLILILEKVAKQDGVQAVIISGEGRRAFAAGADIATMAHLGGRAMADYIEIGQRAMRAVECFPVPVIAAVTGYALGGGLELALACDIIVAGNGSKIGQPEVNLGIIPGFGGTQRLVQRCGIGVAKRLCLTGDIISGEEAARIGLVELAVDDERVVDEARLIAGRIAEKGPLAIRGAKKVVRAAGEALLLAGLRHEVEEFLSLFATADREEGMRAFMEKRAAKFIGK